MKYPLTSLGVVKMHDYHCASPLVLDSGCVLSEFTLRFEMYGTLNEDRSNAILIEHALSGSAHAAGYYENDTKPGWWDILIGPGKAIDTNQFCVISSNTLGSCYGSSGPTSIDPKTGRLYAETFPVVTIADMVRAQKSLTDFLEIKKWACIIGGSMGGMQALIWGVLYPEYVERIIPVAVSAETSTLGLAVSYAGRQAILKDPKWLNGAYPLSNPPANGLAVARMMAHVTYLSQTALKAKFGRRKQHPEIPWSYNLDDTEFAVESYLRYQGGQFVARFDANSYLITSRAVDYYSLYDYSPDGTLSGLFKSLKSKFKLLVLSFSHDWLYLPKDSELIHLAALDAHFESQYYCIESEIGHDAFLLETEYQTQYIKAFLQQ